MGRDTDDRPEKPIDLEPEAEYPPRDTVATGEPAEDDPLAELKTKRIVF